MLCVIIIILFYLQFQHNCTKPNPTWVFHFSIIFLVFWGIFYFINTTLGQTLHVHAYFLSYNHLNPIMSTDLFVYYWQLLGSVFFWVVHVFLLQILCQWKYSLSKQMMKCQGDLAKSVVCTCQTSNICNHIWLLYSLFVI